MSRSRKHTPIHGICTYRAGEMAAFKRQTNRRLRAVARRDPEAAPTTRHAVIERWSAPDDGKTYDAQWDDLRK